MYTFFELDEPRLIEKCAPIETTGLLPYNEEIKNMGLFFADYSY